MAGRRGHTTAGEQLELSWDVPPATPATTDFVCWLWAAFPPKDGRLDVGRIAKALEISTTTLRRWIAKDDPKLRHQQVAKVHQRAILRGHGHYQWPDLDPVSRRRSELLYGTAVRNDELITTEPERIAPDWHRNGTLDIHEVHIVHWERAHAYGVAMTTHDKALARIMRLGTILETTRVPNKYAAIALKHEILSRVDEHRCITPRHLVPTGRTETWREIGGPTTVKRPLEVRVVRFAGRLTRFAQIADHIESAHGVRVRVERDVVTDAATACTALAAEADVVVLTSHGYTRSSWRKLGTKRVWPGGGWYVGGRGRGDAGVSLAELEAGLQEFDGLRAGTFIVDACDLTPQARRRLNALAKASGAHLVVKTDGTAFDSELIELAEIIRRLDEGEDGITAGLRYYREPR